MTFTEFCQKVAVIFLCGLGVGMFIYIGNLIADEVKKRKQGWKT